MKGGQKFLGTAREIKSCPPAIKTFEAIFFPGRTVRLIILPTLNGPAMPANANDRFPGGGGHALSILHGVRWVFRKRTKKLRAPSPNLPLLLRKLIAMN